MATPAALQAYQSEFIFSGERQPMQADVVLEIQRRQPAIPWDIPIRVHFACDDKPLYGCRLCILRFGLKSGDRSRLFASEAEALQHIGLHRDAPHPDAAAADVLANQGLAPWGH